MASWAGRIVSVHKKRWKRKKKKELGQYPAILISRLVNNAYVFYEVDDYLRIELTLK